MSENAATRHVNVEIRSYWFLHHNKRDYYGRFMPLEFTYEPIAWHRGVIKNKPAHEIPARLHALREVKGKLPPEVMLAGKTLCWARANLPASAQGYPDATQSHPDAVKIYTRALENFEWVITGHYAEIMVLFRIECADVAWTEEGGLVFQAPEEGRR